MKMVEASFITMKAGSLSAGARTMKFTAQRSHKNYSLPEFSRKLDEHTEKKPFILGALSNKFILLLLFLKHLLMSSVEEKVQG